MLKSISEVVRWKNSISPVRYSKTRHAKKRSRNKEHEHKDDKRDTDTEYFFIHDSPKDKIKKFNGMKYKEQFVL